MTLEIWLAIIVVSAFIIYTRFYLKALLQRCLKAEKDLAKEKEKLRLLEKLNPESKDEGGFFAYEPDGFIVKKDEFLKVVDRICEVTTMPEKDADYYGHRIAELLNNGYITASPEPERNMEVVFKEPLTVLHPNHPEHAQRINISKVPVIKVNIPMPPVKPPASTKEKNCSECDHFTDHEIGESYRYFCDKGHWEEKLLDSVKGYAKSIDCQDFESK